MVGGAASYLLTIIGRLTFSWIPQSLANDRWYIIGGTIVICLLIATIAGMLATSETDRQGLNR